MTPTPALLPTPALRLALVLALGLVGLLGMVDQASGQPLAAQARQDLSFGELLGGLAERVRPDDGARAGQFRIRGANRTVELTFHLPEVLEGPGGATIPLRFGEGDGHFEPSGGDPRQAFDPSRPITLSLPGPPPWHWIHLGGTALPAASVSLGSYSGTVGLTVADLAN
ncbi:MAG: hypothetical protein EA352_08255 [Gemmatimonadales bacterium]|nr:MAG: hypothetical protein EA352_08255 [Gemmatimonadales bacterium]